MNEIIPIKKDIIFKTKIGEITDISLDHDYKINNGLIEGSVDIYGNYKMTEGSISQEEFFYSIPISIAITKKVKEETIKLDIDDFKYNFNKDILNVNIDLLLTCEEEIKEREEEEITNNFNIDEYFSEITPINNIELEEEVTQNKEYNTLNEYNNDSETNITNITNNIINNENKYYKYKVYIVRQNDTIDSICNKYNVNINEIKEYNDINNINIGDKIIIPQINE